MNVGFIHGVMNTDNMAISGETIDYGPCAFMDAYDPRAVFSSIDSQGRHAYRNQPPIAAVEPRASRRGPAAPDGGGRRRAGRRPRGGRSDGGDPGLPDLYQAALLRGQRAKLGLADTAAANNADDAALARDWLALLQAQGVDFTLGWRRLADAASGDEAPLQALFAQPEALRSWLVLWQQRCAQEGVVSPQVRAEHMRRASPWIIPRNHRVEEALQAASREGDMGPFERLLAALQDPLTGETARGCRLCSAGTGGSDGLLSNLL